MNNPTETLSHDSSEPATSTMKNPAEKKSRAIDVECVYVKVDGEYIPVEAGGDYLRASTYIDDGKYSRLHVDIEFECDQCSDTSQYDDYHWLASSRSHTVTVEDTWYRADAVTAEREGVAND